MLPVESQENVLYNESTSYYKFGDGEMIQATKGCRIPAYIGGTSVKINTDIIEKDLPLLLSKAFMKKSNMVLNFQTDTAFVFGQSLKLATTHTGHYIIPLTKPKQIINNMDQDNSKIVLVAKHVKSNHDIAVKLHRQFAHPTKEKLIDLIHRAGDPWNSNKELIKEVKKVTEDCDTCQRYRKPPPRPVVGLPMASQFLETVAMDLKMYKGKIILHLIDLYTKLSAAKVIPNKQPETVIKALFEIWISVFGSTQKFLMDNGGEFANDKLINTVEKFGITIKTTAAESPWSNGTVERHNQTLANMLDKVTANDDCDFDIAVAWCINAKNLLANVHGFTPYQLAIGTNPQLPTTLTDKPPALTVETSSKFLRDNLQALHASRQAFIECENSEKIRRALAHNIRTSGEVKYITGDSVYWKREGSKEWHGPGKVLGHIDQQILVKNGSYIIRVHPCRAKLIKDHTEPVTTTEEDFSEHNAICTEHSGMSHANNENQPPDSSEDEFYECSSTQDTAIVDLPTNQIVNEQVEVSEEENIEPEEDVIEEEGTIARGINGSPGSEMQERETVENVGIKLRPNLKVRYKNQNSEWIETKVVSRAGKVKGKYDGWWNTEHTTKEVVDFNKIKEIEEVPLESEGDDDYSLVLIAHTKGEVLKAKMGELEQWKMREVYVEEEDVGQNCVSLRWVVNPKVVDGKPSVKARLCAKGFEEIQNFRTDSPTGSREGIRITLLIIASKSWTLHSLDVKTAFLQGKQIDRELYVRPPKEAQTNCVWKLKKTVYGLADASRCWYLKLREELIKLEGTPIQLDQGIFCWYEGAELIGIIICFVDDALWGGTPGFKTVVNNLKNVFQIGSENSEVFYYIGLHLQQTLDSSIKISQQDYVDSLGLIQLSAEQQNDCQRLLTDAERSQLRGALGQLNWLSGMTRPEISFTVSEISSCIKSAKVSNIKYMNKTIKFVKSTPSWITVPKLDIHLLHIKVFHDVSFNNLIEGSSQGGHIVFLCDYNSRCVPLSWSSNKLKRVVRSTLAAETLAATDGADTAFFLAKLLKEILKLPYDIPITCYTDSKSLYDTSGTTHLVSDRRLRVEVGGIREMISRNEIELQWIEKQKQISDVLTKKGASTIALLEVLKSGRIRTDL